MSEQAGGRRAVHMTPLAEFLAEPHEPAPEPSKVTSKKATAKLGGGWLVTVHHAGSFSEIPVPRATSQADAEAQAVEKWRKWQSPEAKHRAAVADALRARRHVPDEVLADYPDLVQKHGRPPEYVRPDERANRVPGSDLRLSSARQPQDVRKKAGGKLVLGIGPDPRATYGRGDVVEVGGVPHVITGASQAARRITDAGGEKQWTGNVQEVQARPLTQAELAVYAAEKIEHDRRQQAERCAPICQE